MDFSSIAGMAGGAAGGSNPWTKIIQMGTKAADGQSGGSAGGGGKGNGMLGKIGARSNMPKEAIMGLGSGLIQSIQAHNLKNKADSAAPGLVDPRQASFLAELNQKRKAIDTGADFAAGMQAIDTTNAGTNNALVAAAGGDAGGTIQALLQSERTANDSKNNVLAQGQNQQMQYNSMFNDLNNKIAARSMQLQMQRSQQARAEWAAKQQSASKNMMAGVAGLMEQKQNYGQPQTTNTQTSDQSGSPSIDLSGLGKGMGATSKSMNAPPEITSATNALPTAGAVSTTPNVSGANASNAFNTGWGFAGAGGGGGMGSILSLKK